MPANFATRPLPSKFSSPPFAGGYSVPVGTGEGVKVVRNGQEEGVKTVVCTCGHCKCRKHPCAFHPMGTNTLMVDPKLKRDYDPKSDYKVTYIPKDVQPVTKRGLSIPAQILAKAPAVPMDLLSMSHQDFIQKPINMITRCKAKHNLKTPRGPFQDATSYKVDYPQRIFDPNPTAPSLMRSTLPRIIEVQPNENYLTTNQATLPDWSGIYHQSEGYKELQEAPFFAGNFHKESVTVEDYSSAAIEGGKPGTSCKKTPTKHALEDFDGNTTNKTVYKLPQIDKRREPVNLKGRSRVMEETMEASAGKMSMLTQYRDDNPGFTFHTSKRWMAPPLSNGVHLFTGKFTDQTEQKSSYKSRSEIPRIRTSFKHNQLATYPLESGKFDPRTVTGVDFRAAHGQDWVLEKQAARDFANQVGYGNKDGKQVKETQNFGGKFQDKSINQTDYFKFWKLPPRTHYGDRCEHIYHPTQAKFEAESETKASFLPLNEKPSEIFKPLDARFHKEGPKYSNKLSDVTAYRNDFAPRPLPKVEACPAEMLQRA